MMNKLKNAAIFLAGVASGAVTVILVAGAAATYWPEDGYAAKFGYDCLMPRKEDDET